MSETLDFCRRAFEEAFFAEENDRLLRRLVEEDRLRVRRAGLAAASGITDDATLDRLVAMGMSPETLAALDLVPLVLVAWADGRMDEGERLAIRKAAAASHADAGSPGGALLEGWLQRQPPAAVLDTALAYIAAVARSLPPESRAAMRSLLLERARTVAEAAGGFLGLGWAVSQGEAALLARLDAALAG